MNKNSLIDFIIDYSNYSLTREDATKIADLIHTDLYDYDLDYDQATVEAAIDRVWVEALND